MISDPSEIEDLLRRARAGDAEALAGLFDRYRERLRQMVRLRLDRRLYGRLDPSDVLQETYLDLVKRFPEYAAKPALPFFLWLRGHTDKVVSVAFSPDGGRLASASWDGTVKLWDAASGQELRILTGHTNLVGSVAFSPDGVRLVSADYDGRVKVWDAASGQELRSLQGHASTSNDDIFP